MGKRIRNLVLAVGLALAALVTVVALAAGPGGFKRAYTVPGAPVEAANVNTASLMASHAIQSLLYSLTGGKSACYGSTVGAGTGFDVNIAVGLCGYDYSTGSTDYLHRYRIVVFTAATVATDWEANPGAGTYYVHVAPGVVTASGTTGLLSEAPAVTVDENATLAGTFTIASVAVGGAEESAATYTYTQLSASFADRLDNLSTIHKALTGYDSTDDQFDATDNDAAAATGKALYVEVAFNGLTPLCTLNADNSGGNADSFAASDDGLKVYVDDNDASGVGAARGVQVYFDEDATNGARLLAAVPSTADCFVPMSDGTLLKITYHAAPGTPGVAVYFDDDAADATARMLFVSPTNASGSQAFAATRALVPAVSLPQ